MARTQYTFTFTNAQPGSAVTFPVEDTDHLYAGATSSARLGHPLILDSSNSVTVWSDASHLTAQTEDGAGNPITATATSGNATVTTDDGTPGATPFRWLVVSKTADFTAADQHIYLIDATSAAVAVTVPHAAGSRCLIVREDSTFAHAVTLTPDSGQIDGSLSSVTLNTAGAALQLVGDGTNVWRLNPGVGGDTTFRNLTVGVNGVGLLNATDDFQHSGDAAGFFGHSVATQPAAIANATNTTDVITQLNLALAALRSLGLIAT